MDQVCTFILIVLCFSCFNPEKDCQITNVQTIYTIKLQNNSDISYLHLLLAEDFDKRCADSGLTMRLVNNYIDTVGADLPVSGIELFNSTKNFDWAETLSQPKSIYKNCLFQIWLDDKTKRPYKFTFYNWLGNESYEGPRWKPYHSSVPAVSPERDTA